MGVNRNTKYIKAFGNHLRSMRLANKMSQEELAYECGLPLSQIGRLERGERGPNITTLLILANGLGVKPKSLLDFDF